MTMKPRALGNQPPGRDAAGQSGEPDLPPSFTAQPAWGFRDPGRDMAYELVRVYGPTGYLRRRTGVEGQVLDEPMSYWRTRPGASSGVPRQGRAITLAQVRERMNRRLSFAGFSSIGRMRSFLVEALDPAPGGAPRPRRSTATMEIVGPPTPGVVSR
jgi:hypothetical protein